MEVSAENGEMLPHDMVRSYRGTAARVVSARVALEFSHHLPRRFMVTSDGKQLWK
jgi:hypothetical protein